MIGSPKAPRVYSRATYNMVRLIVREGGQGRYIMFAYNNIFQTNDFYDCMSLLQLLMCTSDVEIITAISFNTPFLHLLLVLLIFAAILFIQFFLLILFNLNFISVYIFFIIHFYSFFFFVVQPPKFFQHFQFIPCQGGVV